MSIKKAQNAINKVEARLQSPFTAKKEKTPLLNVLDNVCFIIYRVITDAVEGRSDRFDITRNIPLSFGQMVNSKFRDSDTMVKAIEDHAPEYKPSFLICESLYREVLAASVPLTKAEEEKEIQKQQECLMKAQKDDGLRFEQIYVVGHYCHNELGTMWTRYDWYLTHARTAYEKIMVVVGKQFKFWQTNGRPNMKDWDSIDVIRFYREA
ncbi:MAG: hypothetical protein ACJAS1_001621 [Oleiphilaceae bacterium]|jgi:hypothetical protein